MESILEKKNVAILLFVGSLLETLLFFGNIYDYRDFFLAVFILPVGFLFSLITYFLAEPVFRGWINFARWWMPLQILLVALVPEGTTGNFLINLDPKVIVSFALSGIFIAVSLSIVLIQSIRVYRLKK